MGKTIRWLKNLLGGKPKDQKPISQSSDRKWWNSSKSSKNFSNSNQIPVENATEISCYSRESLEDQKRHAIAIATATKAAVDAAVLAAKAAVAVVKLTNDGKWWAAVKIQTVFRGFLARKALRALRGLVKLQALVRGYLVRKQTTATFYSMQSLIKAQAAICSRRAHGQRTDHNKLNKDRKLHPENVPNRYTERFDETRSKSDHLNSTYGRRLSCSTNHLFEDFSKIVEIDSCKTHSRSYRPSNSGSSELSEDPSFPPLSSPRRCHFPGQCFYFDSPKLRDYDECKFSTAQSTPRFLNSINSIRKVAFGPDKTVSSDTFSRHYSNFPSYMANTQSSMAKLRSLSAPKQRPDPVTRRSPLNELMESRMSLSEVQMQKCFSYGQDTFHFKNAVISKLEKSGECITDEVEYLHRRR